MHTCLHMLTHACTCVYSDGRDLSTGAATEAHLPAARHGDM